MTILALGNCTRSLRRFVIKCLGDNTDELVSDVVGEEVTEVHDGSVILKAEPWLLFALAFTSDVTLVSTRNFCFARFSAALGIVGASSALLSFARKFFTRTEVLPKAIFEEGLA